MNPTWKLDRIEVNSNGQGALTALRLHSSFPMQGETRHRWAALLPRLQGAVQKRCATSVRRYQFLQMKDLPRPEGSAALSRHASDWMPGLALGVFPDREPPRSMRKEDFTHRLPGTPFGVPNGEGRQILTTDETSLSSVEAALAGSGALVEIFATEDWPSLDGRAVSNWLLRRMTDDSYRSMPFYFPLLDAKTLPILPSDAWAHCLAGVELYVREAPEAGGILLVARLSFDEVMQLLDDASFA